MFSNFPLWCPQDAKEAVTGCSDLQAETGGQGAGPYLGQKEAASLSHRYPKAVGCSASPSLWDMEGALPARPAWGPLSTLAHVVTNSL